MAWSRAAPGTADPRDASSNGVLLKGDGVATSELGLVSAESREALSGVLVSPRLDGGVLAIGVGESRSEDRSSDDVSLLKGDGVVASESGLVSTESKEALSGVPVSRPSVSPISEPTLTSPLTLSDMGLPPRWLEGHVR